MAWGHVLKAGAATAGRALLRSGNAAGGLNVLQTVRNTLPIIEEEGEVIVWGDHEAKKKDLYHIALALIWGQVTRRNLTKLLPPAGSIMLEYSLEENAVRAVVRLKTSYLDALIASAADPAARRYAVFEGPPDGPYRGGSWQWQARLLPFFPSDVTTGWEGKTMLTRDPTYIDRAGVTRKTQAPSPPGDGVSRGVETIASSRTGGEFSYNPAYLLYAALSIPCSTAGMTRDNSGSSNRRPASVPQPPAGTVTTTGPGRPSLNPPS